MRLTGRATAKQQAPAVAIISGFLGAVALMLIVMPVLFKLLRGSMRKSA
jgi:multidrug efflux pump subunit AcrB